MSFQRILLFFIRKMEKFFYLFFDQITCLSRSTGYVFLTNLNDHSVTRYVKKSRRLYTLTFWTTHYYNLFLYRPLFHLHTCKRLDLS